MPFKILLTFFLLCSSLAFAGVEGMIIKTTDISYHDRWYKTLGSTVPSISSAQHFFKGQKLFIGAAVNNYSATENNKVHIIYDLQVIGPNGDLILDKKDGTVIDSKLQNTTFIQISEDFTTLALKNNDAFGKYKIMLQLKDLQDGSRQDLETTVTLIPLPDYKEVELSTAENYWQWKNNYYKQKEPEKALPYFVFFTKSKLSENRNELWSAISFFRTILKENPFLFTEFREAYIDGDAQTRELLALLLYHSTNEESFTIFMNDDELLEQVRSYKIPGSEKEVKEAVQVDMLWAEFTASGLQQPVKQIVEVLENARYEGYLNKRRKSDNPDNFEDKAYKAALFQGTKWSLEERMKHEKLVESYANWLLASENLTSLQKKELAKLLEQRK